MPLISLSTTIVAPVQIVFDLSRSVDLHVISAERTDERAIAGCTSGLMELGETVTWRAKHLGIYQTLTSQITEMQPYDFFVDEQTQGIFSSMHHKHIFSIRGESTIMKDEFHYVSPLGLLGSLADNLFLKRYMTDFLERRNKVIKEIAESDRWGDILAKSNG